MATEFKKKNVDTLEVIKTLDVIISTINRAEIQTQIDHKELDKAELQLDIDNLKAQLAILDT